MADVELGGQLAERSRLRRDLEQVTCLLLDTFCLGAPRKPPAAELTDTITWNPNQVHINRRLVKEKEKNKRMCSFLGECDKVAAPYPCLLSSYSASMLRLSSAQKITFGSDSAARRHLLAVPLPQSPGRTSESRKPTWVLLKKTNKPKCFRGSLHLPVLLVLLGEQRVPRPRTNQPKKQTNMLSASRESEQQHIAHGHPSS